MGRKYSFPFYCSHTRFFTICLVVINMMDTNVSSFSHNNFVLITWQDSWYRNNSRCWKKFWLFSSFLTCSVRLLFFNYKLLFCLAGEEGKGRAWGFGSFAPLSAHHSISMLLLHVANFYWKWIFGWNYSSVSGRCFHTLRGFFSCSISFSQLLGTWGPVLELPGLLSYTGSVPLFFNNNVWSNFWLLQYVWFQ